VLIATSVAEEGLDIPSTDLVVFYEPVPSEIRTIQRRGRTARKMPGKVIILITKGTPDEGYYWSAKRKEKLMRSELEVLRSALSRELETAQTFYDRQHAGQKNQKTLEEYSDKKHVTVMVDHREYRSNVVRYLSSRDVAIESQQLDVGDYVLSSRIGVERKHVDDFLSSLIAGKLFVQMRKLRDAYSRPVLIVEGDDLLTRRNIGHTAIFGSFVSIIVDFGISIITTKNARETADFLYVMANREQKGRQKDVAIRGDKWSMSIPEQQQYMVEGLPNVSAVLAKRLLQHFGSIRGIVNASEEELCEVQGIGKGTASEIMKLLNVEYLQG
jgi:Fanconi anemia group M protein